MPASENHGKPVFIKLISIVNGIASFLHLFFWILAFFRLSSIPVSQTLEAQINRATTYGFGIADLFLSVPLLIIGSINLWNRRASGWLATQMANVLYWYSFIVILIRDSAAGQLAPGTIIFLPFAVFAIWAAYHLWKCRNDFLR